MIEQLIKTGLSTIILSLTPSDRWSAAKKLSTDSTIPSWFIWSVGIALTVLAVTVIIVTCKQRSQRTRRAK
jgi:hypothetical protein